MSLAEGFQSLTAALGIGEYSTGGGASTADALRDAIGAIELADQGQRLYESVLANAYPHWGSNPGLATLRAAKSLTQSLTSPLFDPRCGKAREA